MKSNTPQIKVFTTAYKNRSYELEYFIRYGTKETILFVHGLGGSKENFWEAHQSTALNEHTIVCFDNPGTGNSSYYEDQVLDMDDLVELISQFIIHLNLSNFILAGASMGGLITLLYLKDKIDHQVKAYINIEGNLLPEDCMFSSKVVQHGLSSFCEHIFPVAIAEMKQNGNPGYYIIANNLELNTNVVSYYHYSFPTVAYSATGELLNQFLTLKIPRLFIYGEKNAHLSYLPKLSADDLRVVMIEESDHFVFYDQPKKMYLAIADFIAQITQF